MDRYERMHQHDLLIQGLLQSGRLVVEPKTGLVYATESKTPRKPVGAKNSRGYLRTCITTRGKATCLMVHRIVWIAVNGVPDPRQQINHKNGRKADNAIANLELVTAAENNAHARSTGLWSPLFGKENGFAKLTASQVEEARRMKRSGQRTADIAKHLGISAGYARRLIGGTARAGTVRT